VPIYVIFGYKWENFGTLLLKKGVKINIRTFSQKYADYRKGFADNIITIDQNLYTGRDNIPPLITLLNLTETSDKITAFIKYTDNEKFFKAFYIKEGNEDYKELTFSDIDDFQDMRAVLIQSVFDVVEKKTVIFKVFIEKKASPKTIAIIGEDISGNKTKTPVIINIPQLQSQESGSN
jgi:hypothetical protein